VRLDGTERIIRRLRVLRLGQRVEQRGFSDVGQTDDSNTEGHMFSGAGLVSPSCARGQKTGPRRRGTGTSIACRDDATTAENPAFFGRFCTSNLRCGSLQFGRAVRAGACVAASRCTKRRILPDGGADAPQSPRIPFLAVPVPVTILLANRTTHGLRGRRPSGDKWDSERNAQN